MVDGSVFARHARALASMSPSDDAPRPRLVLALAAPPSARIEFIHDVLPSHYLVFEPDAAVRADIRRSRKPACLLHPVQRGAADRYDAQHVFFAQHASRSGFIRCHILRFGSLSSRWDHRELLT